MRIILLNIELKKSHKKLKVSSNDLSQVVSNFHSRRNHLADSFYFLYRVSCNVKMKRDRKKWDVGNYLEFIPYLCFLKIVNMTSSILYFLEQFFFGIFIKIHFFCANFGKTENVFLFSSKNYEKISKEQIS